MIAACFGGGIAADRLGRTFWADRRAAAESMYGDCAEAEVDFALGQLRPQALAPYEEVCPLAGLPAVPTTYIIASEDRVVSPDWGRNAAVERLGAQVVELPGSHSPFLSRPAALASILDDIVAS
jgi:pimeloyl-ACP methyl ester carboxylesterase